MNGKCFGCWLCIDRKYDRGWCTFHNKEVNEKETCENYREITYASLNTPKNSGSN